MLQGLCSKPGDASVFQLQHVIYASRETYTDENSEDGFLKKASAAR